MRSADQRHTSRPTESKCGAGLRIASSHSPCATSCSPRATQLVAHGLCEDAIRRPAPHFAANGVDHDEIVGLTRGEIHLDAFLRRVDDAEVEADVATVEGDIELRFERR